MPVVSRQRRRIAVEQAKRKREAMRAEAEGEKAESTRDDMELDILKVDAQSQAAVRIVTVLTVLVSLWFIWIDVLPGPGSGVEKAGAEIVILRYEDEPAFHGFWSEETWPEFWKG